MAEYYIGEVKIVPFTFAPKGWAFCNGQILPINQNQALFSLLGTTYGGNGVTTFALPNLQGSTPIHRSSTYTLGSAGGEINHTLTSGEMPSHTHVPNAVAATATTINPVAESFATSTFPLYTTQAPNVTLNPATVSTLVGGQSHQNVQPYLALNLIIALTGTFPPRN